MTQKTDKTSTSNTPANLIKWVFVVALLVAAFAANTHYASQPLSLRLIGWLAIAIAAGFVALQTSQGSALLGFGKQAQAEMRKVVWPTRPEVVQTTFIVIAMVLVIGVMLWGIDTFLLWAIGLLTGQ